MRIAQVASEVPDLEQLSVEVHERLRRQEQVTVGRRVVVRAGAQLSSRRATRFAAVPFPRAQVSVRRLDVVYALMAAAAREGAWPRLALQLAGAPAFPSLLTWR